MIYHTYIPHPMTHQRINLLRLTVSEIWPRQDFKGQGQNSKVKGEIKTYHDVAHLRPLTNIHSNFHTTYQLPTPYSV